LPPHRSAQAVSFEVASVKQAIPQSRLPLSNFDDRIRIQVARAVYRDPVLSRYALQSVGPWRVS
jgi:hypothetical protein